MNELLSLALVYTVFIGALVSPGPDFLIVVRNALGHNMRAGIFTAAGIAAGLLIHMAYCLAGIGFVISQSVILFNLIKWAGAAYLVYVGIGALRSKGLPDLGNEKITQPADKTDRQAFANGFVTNLFNPKATLFFLALFTQMISPEIPLLLQAAFCGLCIVTAFTWFSLVSLIMNRPAVRRFYGHASKGIDRICGGFFIGLGAKLALA